MKGNNLSDMVFWYKANNDIESYVLGDRKLWYTHYKYYRTDKEMEDIKRIKMMYVRRVVARKTRGSHTFIKR